MEEQRPRSSECPPGYHWLATILYRVQYVALRRVLEGSCYQQSVVVLLRWSNRRSNSPRSVSFLKDFLEKSSFLEDALLLRLPGYSTELRRRYRRCREFRLCTMRICQTSSTAT